MITPINLSLLHFLQEVGCDLKLESGAVVDRCGVCGGDGSSCGMLSGKDMKPYAAASLYSKSFLLF